MVKRNGRLITLLLVGLVIVLIIASLTKNDRLVFIWLIVIGGGLIMGIGREWLSVNRIGYKRRKGLISSYLLFALGSFPYLTAIAVLLGFVYFSALMLFGQPVPRELIGVVRLFVYSLVAAFFGGFALFVLILSKTTKLEEESNKSKTEE